MVRPVEPDPPEALRKLDFRVKRTDAAPDKLGYQHVSERQGRERHEEQREKPKPFPGDSVEIEQAGDATRTDSEPAPGPPTEAEQEPNTGPEHIDLQG